MANKYDSDESSSTCFRSDIYDIYFRADYACTVIFLVVYLGVMVTLCVVRRKVGAGKHLLGLPYLFALFSMFIYQAIQFISSTIQACDAYYGMKDFYSWNAALMIIFGVHTFLMLFVVVWTLNIVLRKQLGHVPLALRVVLLVDLLVLGGLLGAFVSLVCYQNWLAIQALQGNYDSYPSNYSWVASSYLQLTFWVLYLVSILASGALSLLAARSLKKRNLARGSLMFWVSILILSLFADSLIGIIQVSKVIDYSDPFPLSSYTAMFWMGSFFHALALIVVIPIAKNITWGLQTLAAPDISGERQYDAYSHQQDPVYSGADHRT